MNSAFIAIIVVAVIFIAWLFIKERIKKNHRLEVMEQEFPPEYIDFLQENLSLYKILPEELKLQLHKKILVFLDEKPFEGCGGIEITDEIRVTIAGQASMLLLNKKDEFFSILTSVIVYPSAYIAKEVDYNTGSIVDSDHVRLGESWNSGVLVLAWDDVKRGAIDIKDGQNVVLHEFAHQLDQEDGSGNGAPILEQSSVYVSWARVLGKEFEVLQKKKKKHKKSVMDKYGATNPAEFFAVATETFFEKSWQMKQKHPELYEELKNYYKVDPLEWRE